MSVTPFAFPITPLPVLILVAILALLPQRIAILNLTTLAIDRILSLVQARFPLAHAPARSTHTQCTCASCGVVLGVEGPGALCLDCTWDWEVYGSVDPGPHDVEALEEEYRRVEAEVQLYEAQIREYLYSTPCPAYTSWKE